MAVNSVFQVFGENTFLKNVVVIMKNSCLIRKWVFVLVKLHPM